MSRLINADKVQHDICELYKIYGDGMCSLEFIAHMINSVPTVEAIPIEWLRNLQDKYYEESEWLLFTAVGSILEEWEKHDREGR